MRVVKFVTLFLALAVITGCSHRRAQRVPVTASLCDCSACRHDQEQLVLSGAVPSGHFGNFEASRVIEPVVTTAPLATPIAAPSQVNDFTPGYAEESSNEARSFSPYSSGNPIEMDSEAPGTFDTPAIDQIKTDRTLFPPSDSANDLQLGIPSSNQITPLDDVPSETIPDGAFKPFNREVFQSKSKVEDLMQLKDQSPTLTEKVSESFQPDLSSYAPTENWQLQLPKLSEPEANEFQIPDSIASEELSLEQTQTEVFEPVQPDSIETAQTFEPVAQELEPIAQELEPIAQPIRQTETIVHGELYEDPVVLYARQRRNLLTATPVQQPGKVKPASVQKPVEQQGIAQTSQYDPIYGLPLTNNVDFDSLPAIEQPLVAPAPSEQPQHLHVHIHHDYTNAATGPVRQIQQTGQDARNVQVVYRDDEGRVIMAPPTPTGSINSAQPNNDQRTYYVPPEQILRLKATSPISRQRSNPSVATIQMRDTIIHGGTHLLATPDYQAQPVLTNHGLPGINHEKLREAFNTSQRDNPLR